MLGVGRTPVRDALTSLRMKGLIDVQAQRGSFVFFPSASDIAELCQYREVIEIEALRLCHTRAKDATLAQMRRASEDMKAATRMRRLSRAGASR